MRISYWSSDVCSSDLFCWNGCAQQPELAHFGKNGWIGFFVAKGFEHAGGEFVLSISLRGIAHHTFLLCKLAVQQLGVLPMKRRGCRHNRRSYERRVGNECVSTCSSLFLPSLLNTKF